MSDLVNIVLKPPQIVFILEERKGSKSLPHHTTLSSEKKVFPEGPGSLSHMCSWPELRHMALDPAPAKGNIIPLLV